jgi:dUTP pyrophosphatase
MRVRFSKTHPNAVIPKHARPGDAGVDLVAVDYKYVTDTESPYHEYNLGIAVEIPEGFVGLLFPRSSNTKKDLQLGNTVGVVDSGFRGTITARFKATRENPQIYNVGDRVCQLVIVPCLDIEAVEVPYEALTVTERGAGAYGSTGK